MNIGITCYPTYGGSGIVASELGIELGRRGHQVHFICASLPTRLTELSERIHFHEVEIMDYPLFEHVPYDLALATKQLEVALDVKLDILHVHYAIPHSISAFLAREMLKPERYLPIVTTLHGTDITLVGRDRSYLPMTRFGIHQSDGVTAVSEDLRRATCEIFGRCQVEVIPNFIDETFYVRRANMAKRAALAPHDEPLLIHVSNFRPPKRAPDCIEILARVRRHVPARLIMVGDGPDRANAEWLARQRGVADAVHFVGKQPNVPEYLSLADVLLLPSELESFGLAALEAMACEVPVVASRVGGLPEVVDHGETGYLLPVGDVAAMAEAVIHLLQDDSLRQAMGQRARARAIERFSSRKIIPLYEAFYQRVLEQVKPT
ncbi:MAG: N-acetyl-alpha-D-glucosaminyl L-malate synthase BshA [Acidobacteriota bacterium]|nr:N-acetyl-alpha-D-glucosaminyl L-malate synthase BshA [Blastocatellia bacterium]MDW8240720.1 N-acetyl-alpha-D-glucosaminyl L-malate synthase BshA [Acidobacteriota bacterium]